MITINTNRLESNKDEDKKYAEISTAAYIIGCMSDNEIALLKERLGCRQVRT